jgi:lipid II isoglutaminyl synthase (glutamine-hydrolysing)
VAVSAVALGEVPPAGGVGWIYAIGGAEDEDAPILAGRLRDDGTLAAAVRDGAVVFGSGMGYELLGESFEDADRGVVRGVGLLEATFRLGAFVDRRVVTRPNAELGLPPLSGYESHRGRAALGAAARPLAEIEIGTGNGGETPADGAIQVVRAGHVVGTWLHGPVLPRNPELADLVLAWAVGVEPSALEPLGERESRFAERVRSERIAEARRYAKVLVG